MRSEDVLRCLGGTDRPAAFRYLNEELLPRAVAIMNRDALPVRLAVFDADRLPTNQRNLTDVRTRVGSLLEWELGLAISAEVAQYVNGQLQLTYVVANRFPDLELRGPDGSRGLRFEIKAVDVEAEEKAANFDTLIKDIRAGSDYVIVLIWEMHRPPGASLRYPRVGRAVALDAEHLAKMRDFYWLNTPPRGAGSARQGFDLRYPVNCSGDHFSREEGNLGKLMRLFDADFQERLPEDVRLSPTFDMYFQLREQIVARGFMAIAKRLCTAFHGIHVTSDVVGTRSRLVFERDGRHLVVLGDREKPSRADVRAMIEAHGPVAAVVAMNAKFQWSAYRDAIGDATLGRKPGEAEEFVRSL